MTWAVVPAAGRGTRFGGETPKQYLNVAGRPLIEHSLRALLGHPAVDGVMVALAPDDPYWGGWREIGGKPVYTCVGGAARAEGATDRSHHRGLAGPAGDGQRRPVGAGA